MNTSNAILRPPLSALLIYAVGQFGWSLTSFAATNLLVYFYMPPETGNAVFPSLVFQGPVLGLLTLIGLLSAFGRLFDAVIDPIVANWSDRKYSVMGKRRWFMAVSAVPFAVTAYLVFNPPSAAENAGNAVWLAACLLLYYFFFTLYLIPYTALIAELGHDKRDRLRISTLISISWALGFMVGNGAYALQSWWEGMGMSSLEALQRSILLLSGIGLAGMLIPVFFLRENRYALQEQSEHPLWESLRIVFKNRSFRYFLLSDLMYWLALNFIQLGIGYYITLLLDLDKSYAFVFSLVSFLCSFAFYWPVNWMARRFGKKKPVLWAFWVFAVLFGVVATAKWWPIPNLMLLYGLAAGAAFPLAVFGILPNAIIGDVVAAEGTKFSGMFYGVRAFTMKVGISLANLLFPSLLLLGKSTQNPAGVQVAAVLAIVFCMLGWRYFRQFEES